MLIETLPIPGADCPRAPVPRRREARDAVWKTASTAKGYRQDAVSSQGRCGINGAFPYGVSHLFLAPLTAHASAAARAYEVARYQFSGTVGTTYVKPMILGWGGVGRPKILFAPNRTRLDNPLMARPPACGRTGEQSIERETLSEQCVSLSTRACLGVCSFRFCRPGSPSLLGVGAFS